jgi:membrane complex biogenesis BtpA family protein
MFRSKKPVIGALHFMPLLGYPGFRGLDIVLAAAVKDLHALQDGGIDGIILENNYDIPHKISVGPETIASMTYLCSELAKISTVPLGVSVLWNDFKAGLAIAKVIGAKFVRVPVFVDDVETDFGIIYCNPKEVLDYRSNLGADDDIAIFADIQVKHARMLKSVQIEESAALAQSQGADAIIVTGKWTGDAPLVADIKRAKSAVKIPVLVGSGMDINNAAELLTYSDGAIVSTSVKNDEIASANERNVKSCNSRVSKDKVKMLMNEVKSIIHADN